eukprot:s1037_g7.t1
MLQASAKRPMNRAMSMMDLGETIDLDEDKGSRAPPCKRPRRTDEVLRDLDSPDVAKKMTAIKAGDKAVADVAAGDVLKEFRGHNLAELGLPRSARPRAGFPYAGKHGYTLKAPNGAAIEVLLKTRAYVVKRLPNSTDSDSKASSSSGSAKEQQRLGQISLGKFGGASNAWSIAASSAGFPGEEQ